MGQRQFTRAQRTQVATLFIDAAMLSSGGSVGIFTTARGQLAHGLALLTDGKHDSKTVLGFAGLGDALKDQSSAKSADLAAAWELAVWPTAVPANKKDKGEAAPAGKKSTAPVEEDAELVEA